MLTNLAIVTPVRPANYRQKQQQ